MIATTRFSTTAVTHIQEPPSLVRARQGQKYCDLPPTDVTVCSRGRAQHVWLRVRLNDFSDVQPGVWPARPIGGWPVGGVRLRAVAPCLR
jgi:hypothetical protein